MDQLSPMSDGLAILQGCGAGSAVSSVLGRATSALHAVKSTAQLLPGSLSGILSESSMQAMLRTEHGNC